MIKRCAVYTRKSTEEGLDQAFNSLDAQREACEAYIASQKNEGWRLVKNRFDDGGVSGGTVNRPALQALLGEIDAGRIDIIVVYKVDRLTRSLADFAKLVEKFEEKDVSFVSVTQAFNTSNSMGRLTLNVLLSFAQFEREVGAERVRDKIAASKKKGLYTGGPPPLGYDNIERKLVVNEEEAEIVRAFYALYIDHGCVRTILRETQRKGWRTKTRANRSGDKHFGRGGVYHILANPLYAGFVPHKGELHPGEHKAIIDEALWRRVQDRLKSRTQWSGKVKTRTSPLAGKLFAGGHRLTPSHASKNGVRYRYYVTDKRTRPDDASVDVWRLRAEEFERAVERILDRWIENRAAATNQLLRPNAPAHIIENVRREVDSASQGVAADGSTTSIYKWAELIDRVEIKPNSIAIELDPRMLVHAPDADSFLKSSVDISASLQLQQRGQERRLVLGDIETERALDPVIAKLLQRAARWKREWFGREASSLESIAKSDGVLKSDASKQVRLAFLAPDIVEALLDGSAPVDVTAESLRRLDDLPLSWAKQRALLGFRQTS